MSWQEELEQLDAQLAEGRIDAQEHRRRADDLLAGVSGPTPSARTWRSQSPKQFAERDTQRLRPPWERGPAITQPKQPAEQPAPEPRPNQRAQPEQREHATQPDEPAQPGQPAQPGRSRPQPPPQPGTPGRQHAQREPHATPSRAAEPTWPPVAPAPWQKATDYQQPPGDGQSDPAHPNPADRYLAAQQRLTEPTGTRGKPRKLLFAVLGGGLLLLVVVALVVWLVAFRTGSERAGAAQPQQPVPVSSTTNTETTGQARVPKQLADRLPRLPGDRVQAGDEQPIDSIVGDGYYSEQIAEAISKAGPKSMLVRQSVREGDELYLLAVIPTTSPRNCQASAAAINDFQRDIGLTDAKHNAFGANTSMLRRADKHGVYYRTVYCSARMTVITAGASAHRKSAAGLRKQFTRFGKSVQTTLPPN